MPFRRKIARASLAITVCAIGAPVWLLVMWIRGGFRGLMKGSNLTFSGSISGTPKDSPAAVDTAVTRKAEDASEKVVTTTLEASEGGESYRAMLTTRHVFQLFRRLLFSPSPFGHAKHCASTPRISQTIDHHSSVSLSLSVHFLWSLPSRKLFN